MQLRVVPPPSRVLSALARDAAVRCLSSPLVPANYSASTSTLSSATATAIDDADGVLVSTSTSTATTAWPLAAAYVLRAATAAADVRWVLPVAGTSTTATTRFESELRSVAARAVRWSDAVDPTRTRVKVRARCYRSRLFHEGLVRQVVEEELRGRGYAVAAGEDEEEDANVSVVNVKVVRDQAQFEVSLVGAEPLMRRGYRAVTRAVAPVPEHIAAGAVAWALHALNVPVANVARVLCPFSGSGTLGFEAAIVARNVPLTAWGRRFAIESIPVAAKAAAAVRKTLRADAAPLDMVFLDSDAGACAETSSNLARFSPALNVRYAQVLKANALQVETLEEVFPPQAPPTPTQSTTSAAAASLIVMNPPYGVRVGAQGWSRPHRWGALGAWVSKLSASAEASFPCTVVLVMCPTETTWSALHSGLGAFTKPTRVATTHVTHGGRDLRLLAASFHRPQR